MHTSHTLQTAFTPLPRSPIAGMTLIELMVALAIGAFLMIGAVTVFMQSRTTFRVNESVSRMQENARFAIEALEPDIRMAHYWGLTTRTTKIVGRAATTAPAGIGPATCGNNWTIDLDRAVDGTNNGYGWACAPTVGAAQAGSDTLVVRRVSEDAITAPLPNNTMYLQTARLDDALLFIGTGIPAGYLPPPVSETRRLIVNGYYISTSSSQDAVGNPVPSLRRKTLVRGAAGPEIQDHELLSGVEDLQVQFGVDTDALGEPERGSIDRYVNPGDPILDPTNAAFIPDAEVLAVRIWLRLRAERPENGFTDATNYVYADRNIAAIGDQFRRLVVSKTIYLRNARPAL
jgi:type IV pilus assembly protein PilW